MATLKKLKGMSNIEFDCFRGRPTRSATIGSQGLLIEIAQGHLR